MNREIMSELREFVIEGTLSKDEALAAVAALNAHFVATRRQTRAHIGKRLAEAGAVDPVAIAALGVAGMSLLIQAADFVLSWRDRVCTSSKTMGQRSPNAHQGAIEAASVFASFGDSELIALKADAPTEWVLDVRPAASNEIVRIRVQTNDEQSISWLYVQLPE
jgi:hypothetical protein